MVVIAMLSPRRLWVATLALPALGLALGCQGAGSARPSAGARLWLEGPVKWLMLPEEVKEFRKLRHPAAVAEHIEEFWRRRDPTPGDGENPFRTTFLERSEAADRLYGGEGSRGSLTDRGRALILLGPPTVLRYRQVPTPVLDPERPQPRQARQRWMTQEVWAYLPEDLPPGLLELLPAAEAKGEVALVFAVEARRTYLLDGEKVCELAARAAIVAGPPP